MNPPVTVVGVFNATNYIYYYFLNLKENIGMLCIYTFRPQLSSGQHRFNNEFFNQLMLTTFSYGWVGTREGYSIKLLTTGDCVDPVLSAYLFNSSVDVDAGIYLTLL